MKFENTEVWGFRHALRGMRNALESWDKSDSYCYTTYNNSNDLDETFVIGESDLKLATKLIKAGGSHRKFLRQIFVSVDITAPLYWFKEFDTYKVGTVANSTSTMHKLTTIPITKDCFEIDEEIKDLIAKVLNPVSFRSNEYNDEEVDFYFDSVIEDCEKLRLQYLKTKDKKYWRALIQLLPESWLQRRTITMNYENILNMVEQRKNHKLKEWSVDFINWAKTLPYSEELIFNCNCTNCSCNNKSDSELSEPKQDYIALIVGASGSGKTTIVEKLEGKYGLKSIQSYTTREPRYEDEEGHIFITKNNFEENFSSCYSPTISIDGSYYADSPVMAYTYYNGNHYFATKEQVDDCQLYVIDKRGIEEFHKKYNGNKKVLVIYIDCPVEERFKRMLNRGDSVTNAAERIINDEELFNDIKADLRITNTDLDKTVDDIYNFLEGEGK